MKNLYLIYDKSLFILLLTIFSNHALALQNEGLAPKLPTFPLAPANLSSPYETLNSFLQLTTDASQLLIKRFGNDVEDINADELESQERYIYALVAKAQSCFDISSYPEASKKRVGLESVLLLREILQRIPSFEITKIPGSPTLGKKNPPAIWTIPNTLITLKKTSNNRYKFSAETTKNLKKYYDQIKHLPPSDNSQMDLYQFFEASPGTLFPPYWFRYLETLPPSIFVLYGDQALWQWLAFIFLLLVYSAIIYLLARYTRLLKTSVVGACFMALSLHSFLWLLENQVNIGGHFMQKLTVLSETVIWPLLAIAAYQAVFNLFHFLAMIGVKDSLKQSMLKVISTIVSLIVALMIASYGATRIGIPVYGVITSLSLGGMAIALAIRPTMENLIGGVILYLDKAIKVGDYCEFDGIAGTIEAIGIRSTKIRALDRTLITIANGSMVRMKLTNYSKRDKFHLRTRLSVTYKTSTDDLMNLIESLSCFLRSHEHVAKSPLRVNFTSFSSSSLDIDIHAYIYAKDRSEFLIFQQDILLSIANILEKNHVEFAYPTQTLHMIKAG